MKQLGDTYVRQEFNLHKEAKTEQLYRFMQSWENYLVTLQSQKVGSFGQDMQADDVNRMTEEQKKKMQNLKSPGGKN
jgi:hypothetical protein